MSNQFSAPILGEIFAEDFERDGVEKALGCSADEARNIVDLRKLRQLRSGRITLDVLRGIRENLEQSRVTGANRP